MHVFITGGTGFVGGIVVRRLVSEGHSVTGLARSKAAELRLHELGAAPLSGDLSDAELLREATAEADAAVHAAIDYGDPAFGLLDAVAVGAMLSGLERPARLLYLSSTLVYGDTAADAATEDREPAPLVQPFKLEGERAVVEAGGVALRPGLVYGSSGSALLDGMRDSARESGTVDVVGDGSNVWSTVHGQDLARLTQLVLERTPSGVVLNATAGDPVAIRDVAAAVAAGEGATIVSIAVADAAAAMGAFAEQLTRNLVADSSRARRELGWEPTMPGPVTEPRNGSSQAALEQS